ncbi:MAG: SBBP repeat-containing protein [bacterium]
MKNYIILTILALFSLTTVSAQNYFIENKGQWTDEVLFKNQSAGNTTWITKSSVVFDYAQYSEISENEFSATGQVIKMEFLNSNLNTEYSGKKKLSAYHNYFIGNNQNKWKSKVALYEDAVLTNVYEGIDLKFYWDEGTIRYDFIVGPKSNPNQIKLKFSGQDDISISKDSELCLTTRFGEIKHTKLLVYQMVNGQKTAIKSAFVSLADNTFKFEIGAYDKSRELVIDPLIYSTYIGTSDNDRAFEMTLAPDGKPIIVGLSWNSSYPTSSGAYQKTVKGNSDGILTKMNDDCTAVLFSTFYGGSQWEEPRGIDYDTEGNIYIAGETMSTDFPVSSMAYQKTAGGNNQSDAFVLKFSSDGSQLIFSTYLGTAQADQAKDLKIDPNGFVFVIGEARSSAFPITANAVQKTYSGGPVDGFLTVFSPDGKDLVYSTFIGGTGDDFPRKILLDGDFLYIVGHTRSTDFPVTANAYQKTIGGNRDAFLIKYRGQGTETLFSTFIGGSLDDSGIGMCFDANKNIIFTGNTFSTNYPVTNDAVQKTLAGDDDVMVTKFNPAGNLIYSTFIGGKASDRANDIRCDEFGNYYLTGMTKSNNYPTTLKALQKTYISKEDVLVTKLNPNNPSLLYSTYLAGNNEDWGRSIACYGNTVIVTGYTSSSDFLISDNAYKKTFSGNRDIFLTKFSPDEGTLDKPILVNPVKGAVDVIIQPTLIWEKVDYADAYTVIVAKDIDLTNKVFSQTGITTLQKKIDTELESNKKYYWAVTAKAGAVVGPQSDVYSFTTEVNLSVPTLISPPDKADDVVLTPKFTWSQEPNTDNYHLRLLNSNNPDDIIFEKLFPTETEYVSPITLEEGKEYFWTVRTIYNGEIGPWASISSFTTKSTIKAPILVYPADKDKYVQSKNTLFYWKKEKTATQYEIYIYEEADLKSPIKTALISDTFYINNSDLEYGKIYYWTVRSKSSNQTSSWTEMFSFQTEVVMEKPILISPENFTKDLTIYPKFVWHRVNYAVKYKLEIMIPDALVYQAETSDTSFQMLEPLENGAGLYWQVRAIGVDETEQLSDTWEFSTIDALIAPTLVSPDEMAQIDPATATFVWNKVPHYDGLYNIQIYKRPGSVLVIDEIVEDTVYTVDEPLLYNQGYYWQVSYFRGDETSPWSIVRRFTTYPTSVKESPLFSSIKLYPNPTGSKAELSINYSETCDAKIFISTVGGKIIKTDVIRLLIGETRYEIDTEHLTSGSYYITITTPAGYITRELVVVK